MKNIFHGILIVTPMAALILFFSLQNKEEIKADQRVHDAQQAVTTQKFDNEFDDAWNGKASTKEKRERAKKLEELKVQVDKAKAKRDGLDEMFDQNSKDFRDAMSDIDSQDGGTKK